MNHLVYSELPAVRPTTTGQDRGIFPENLKPWPGEVQDEWEMDELGSDATRPEAPSEQQIVRTAISRGQQSESALTDLVFARRHPQRRGRRLQRGEPESLDVATGSGGGTDSGTRWNARLV